MNQGIGRIVCMMALAGMVAAGLGAVQPLARDAGDATASSASGGSFGRSTSPGQLAVVRSRVGRIDFAKKLDAGLGGEMRLHLFDDVRLTVLLERIEQRGPARATWFGSVAGVERSSVIIVQHEDAYVANIWASPVGHFQVRPVRGNRYLIEETDPLLYPGCGCGMEHEVGLGGAADPGFGLGGGAARTDGEDEVWVRDRRGGDLGADGFGTDGGDDGSIFDVAVFYTPEAAAAAGGTSAMQALVQAAIDVSNEAYTNSLIGSQLRLVHVAETVQNETGDMNDQLDALTQPSDGLYDEVHAKRDQFAADLVALLCDDSSFCGIAWLMTELGNDFESLAFSVTNWSCAVGNRTFPHELGHNMGCAHDRDNAGTALFDYSYGWRWFGMSGEEYRTVMAYDPGERVPHFSNPSVEYDGVATGVADSEDNARSINEAALTIANWRVSGGVGSLDFVYPGGLPPFISTSGGTTFQVNVIPGLETPQPGTGMLHYDMGQGFVAVPMTDLGGDSYEATFPPATCGTIVNFYISVETTTAMVITDPATAPASVFSRPAADSLDPVFTDDFESDLGWTVQNTNLSDGAWERGVPAGDGSRGDPTVDFDGSGQCYLTANRAGNSDVDGGPTVLTSPVIDVSDDPDATLRYARWFANDDEDEDRLNVEISNDGGQTWVMVESVADIGEPLQWVLVSVPVADFVTPTHEVQVRFSTFDVPNNSITEAGIDAFSIDGFICTGGGGTSIVSFEVVHGFHLSGGVAQLSASDDDVWVGRSAFGFSAQDANMHRLNVLFNTTVASPSTLDVRVESRLNNPGGTSRMRLTNWGTGLFEEHDAWPIGSAEIVNTTTGIAAANHVNAQGDIRMQLQNTVIATFSAVGFDVSVDEVRVTPN